MRNHYMFSYFKFAEYSIPHIQYHTCRFVQSVMTAKGWQQLVFKEDLRIHVQLECPEPDLTSQKIRQKINNHPASKSSIMQVIVGLLVCFIVNCFFLNELNSRTGNLDTNPPKKEPDPKHRILLLLRYFLTSISLK